MNALRRRPRLLFLVGAGLLIGGASISGGGTADARWDHVPALPAEPGDFSVMTYNVKGLPWPVAWGRGAALLRIGDRLADLRAAGHQPSVVVLQEAFTADAKAIGERAGYRYRVFGADRDGVAAGQNGPAVARQWYLGETQGKQLDSGLLVLSDFPIVEVARAAFPADACAGFDCLAAKGVVLVTIELPGKGRVAVATTHFNSRGASYAPAEETARAYAAQAEFLAAFLAHEWTADAPLVLAGDFNMGRRPFRQAVLPAALSQLLGGGKPAEGLRRVMAEDEAGIGRSPDARSIRMRARDMQFILDSRDRALVPVGATIPFGTEKDGSALSDHMGFVIHYRIVPGGSSVARGRRNAAPARPATVAALASRTQAPTAGKPGAAIAAGTNPMASASGPARKANASSARTLETSTVSQLAPSSSIAPATASRTSVV